jgi:hypothetical protein
MPQNPQVGYELPAERTGRLQYFSRKIGLKKEPDNAEPRKNKNNKITIINKAWQIYLKCDRLLGVTPYHWRPNGSGRQPS